MHVFNTTTVFIMPEFQQLLVLDSAVRGIPDSVGVSGHTGFYKSFYWKLGIVEMIDRPSVFSEIATTAAV